MVGFALYLITDEERALRPAAVEAALSCVPRGSVAVQLRAKGLSARALLEAARALRVITARAGAPLFVNDRFDVALCAGADGVHLPASGLPVAEVRRLAPTLLVGRSTHSVEEAARAAAAGAHFVTFGPVFATPSKARFGPPLGDGALARAVAACAAPVYALGGIDEASAASCRAAGARLAVIRAVLDARDPAAAALALASPPSPVVASPLSPM